jgi:hypothetical protein
MKRRPRARQDRQRDDVASQAAVYKATCCVCGRQICLYPYAKSLHKHGPRFHDCLGSWTKRYVDRVLVLELTEHHIARPRPITPEELDEHAGLGKKDGCGKWLHWKTRWQLRTGVTPK